MKKIKSVISIIVAVIMLVGVIPLVSACNKDTIDKDLVPTEKVVYYSEYGAVGDGKTDDFQAIYDAHKDANEKGIAVAADRGKTYYIGGADEWEKQNEYIHRKSIIVKTNTYWQDAKFIIDDRDITDGRVFYKPIFLISSDIPAQQVELDEDYTLSVGATNVNLTFVSPMLLHIENANKKDFIRSGVDQNNGYARQEIILVDENGNIDKTTPLTWDYTEVTSMRAISTTDKPITISGGKFTTIANNRATDYFWRNIQVSRSNTTVKKVYHDWEYKELKDSRRAAYAGFLSARETTNVIFEDCKVTGIDISGAYELGAKLANNVLWKNVSQTNEFKGNGIFGSNYCRNLRLEGCKLNRFDAHMGVYNATLTNSTIGGGGISVVGFGTLLIDNVTRIALAEKETEGSGSRFVYLRGDSGAFWDGEIIIKNSHFTTNGEFPYIIYAGWEDWDYGYPCPLPNLTVENFVTEYTGTFQQKYQDKSVYYLVINRYMSCEIETIQNSKNPVEAPEYVHLKNVSPTYRLSNNNKGFYDNTEFINE